MGCDLLALDLVRNWEFLAQPKDTLQPLNQISDPRKMFRRRSSLVVDDLPSPKFPVEKRAGDAKSGPTPTAWKESPMRIRCWIVLVFEIRRAEALY